MSHLKILRKRAEKLAKPIDKLEQIGDFYEIMIFNLGDESYGIETKYIEEVYPLKEYTSLPKSPPFVLGLINVRRKIILIIDLKSLFSIPKKSNEEPQKLIILSSEENYFGILSDGVHGILKVMKEGLQSALPTLTGVRADFLKGILINGTVLLDGEKLLKSKTLKIEDAVE